MSLPRLPTELEITELCSSSKNETARNLAFERDQLREFARAQNEYIRCQMFQKTPPLRLLKELDKLTEFLFPIK